MIASIQEMSSNTTQQLRVSSRRAPRTRRSWQPRGLIVLRLVVSAYLLQCATADVIGPNTDSFSPTFRELIERLNRSEGRPAVQSTMPSGTRRRLGWYRKGKKFMKNVASLADAGLMALDDMTDEAWEDVKEATATGANALKAAVAKAKKLAKNTGKRAAQAADTMLTQIDNTVSDLYDEVEAGIDEWRDDQALDNAEDWFWPDYASKLGSYYCDNHHGVRSMWGSMDAHTYPVECTECTPRLELMFEALADDALYQHKDEYEYGERCYLTDEERENLQKVVNAVEKHAAVHTQSTRLGISAMYLQQIINLAPGEPDDSSYEESESSSAGGNWWSW